MRFSECFAALAFATAMLAQVRAITNCSVVDPRTGTVAHRRTIIIRGERIESVVAAQTARVPRGAEVIRGSGSFVIPGLWDMHVHVGEIEEDWFPLYLANGVTGLREMAASERNAPKQQAYRNSVIGGRRIGPELFWTLFPLDSPAIRTEAQARGEVARRAAMGLKYVKVYNGLSRAAWLAIVDECRRRGMQVTGHVPDSISVREAAQAGQSSIEHLDGMLIACSSREAEARLLVQANRYPWKMLLETFDARKADALLDTLREHGVWQVPTLTLYRVAAPDSVRQLTGDPRLKYVRPDYGRAWPREARQLPFSGLDGESARQLEVAHRWLVRRMHVKGVQLLAGTDTPNPYCIPGFALHDEMALLTEAGLPPAAALRAATSSAAEFLKVAQDYGSVERGKIADLVMLDANPLLEIRNVRRIRTVFRRGHRMDPVRLLQDVEARTRKVPGREVQAGP